MSAVGRVKKLVSRVGAVGKPSDVGNAEVVEEATKQIPHAVGNLRDVRKWIKEEPGAYQEVLERRKKHLKSLVRIRRAARKDLQEANFRRGVARIGVGTAVAGAGAGGGYYGYRKYKKKKEASLGNMLSGAAGGGLVGGAIGTGIGAVSGGLGGAALAESGERSGGFWRGLRQGALQGGAIGAFGGGMAGLGMGKYVSRTGYHPSSAGFGSAPGLTAAEKVLISGREMIEPGSLGGGLGAAWINRKKKKPEGKEKKAGVNWKGIGLTGGGMVGGALSGALVGAHEAQKRSPIKPTNKEIDAKYKMIAARVKAHQDPTYVNKTRAANAQLAYEVERAGREHPKGHIARRASQGAVAGGLTAPALAYGGKRLYKILKGSAS